MKSFRRWLRASGTALVCAATAAQVCASRVALASPTDPVLVVSAVRTAPGTAGAWLRIDGVLPGDDLVQIAYPLQLLVVGSGSTPSYVRFDLAGGVFLGTEAALADGLDAGEAIALLTAGSAAPDGAVLRVAPGAIEVQLPLAFPSGAASAQLFVLHDGEAILSNAVPFTLEATP